MRRLSMLLIGIALMPGLSAAAVAQSAVNVKGKWVGTSNSIVAGLPAHHPSDTPSKPAGPARLTALPITITIEGQEDRRFWGTLASAAKSEPLIGVISSDGKRLRMVAQGGGTIEGTVLDDGSIELFYVESRNGVSVAATNLLKRQ